MTHRGLHRQRRFQRRAIRLTVDQDVYVRLSAGDFVPQLCRCQRSADGILPVPAVLTRDALFGASIGDDGNDLAGGALDLSSSLL